MPIVDLKAKNLFAQQVSHKGLLLKLEQRFNLPSYVLDSLIARYKIENSSITEIETEIKSKIVTAKNRLKIEQKIKEMTELVIIDKVKIRENNNDYLAELSNLELSDVKLTKNWQDKNPELLEKAFWSEIKITYQDDAFEIIDLSLLKEIEFDLAEYQDKVDSFTFLQWITFLLRSLGFSSNNWSERKKLLFLSRLIPLVEKNYNFIELGPRSTGKSYFYRQLFPQAILVSGGKTTVANLFYDMRTKKVGLVGKWDVVAFDEVAYIDFKDKSGVQILKDYMESGSFSRGEEELFTEASMVFLGNINQDLRDLLNQKHLFEPLPELMKDLALIDRFHFYLPGWELDKLNESDFTEHFGLQNSYLSLVLQSLRELDFSEAIDQYFQFSEEMDIRDKKAIKKTVSGFLKLLHPHGNFEREDLKIYLDLAIEARKRVKEQLVKMGSFEYERNNFSYFDLNSKEEFFPTLPEDQLDFGFKRRVARPGIVYIGQIVDQKKFALIRLEIEAEPGKGKMFFKTKVNQNLKMYMRKSFLHLKNRTGYNKIDKDKIKQNDFYVSVEVLTSEIKADISNAFIIALYSLLNNKAIANGLLVTEQSSLYRKTDSNYGVKALKVEEDGQVKTLLPLSDNNVFVEVPSEVIAYAPYFIVV